MCNYTNIRVFSPSQRSAEDLEVIYEELLHVKAAAHLSTSVSRALLMKAAELLIPVCVEAERKERMDLGLAYCPVVSVGA